MRVEEIMTRAVFTSDTHADLESIARVMWDHDCGYVPIVNDEDKLTGVVTDRDIAMAAYNQGKRLAEIPVAEVMAKHVHSCEPSASVELAHQIMRSAEIRRLPVVDQAGKLVGLVTWSDLFAAAQRESNASAAAALTKQVIQTLEATLNTD
jgi:predicted transcriptional regulator